MLKDLRREIALEVTSLDGFEAYRLKRLQDNIGRLIGKFNDEATKTVHNGIKNSVELGGKSVTGPMKRIGLDVEKIEKDDPSMTREPFAQIGAGPVMQITPQQAIIAMDFSADLIKAISDPMRAQINKRIRMAILGQKTPIDMMREITKVLGIEARTGVWKKRKDPVRGVAARAETDLRTELQRAYNLAHHAQQQRVTKIADNQGVRLLKGWTATADMRTRHSHLMAHRTYGKNPIPIDDPFIIRGESGKEKGKKYELMYPGDPNGPPGLTINCRCKMYTTTDRVGVIGSSLDGRIGAELKRRGQ